MKNLEQIERIVYKIETSNVMKYLNYFLGSLIIVCLIGFVWLYVLKM